MENMTPCRAASRTSGAMRPAGSATSSAVSQGVSDAPGSTVRRWGVAAAHQSGRLQLGLVQAAVGVDVGGDAGQGHGQVEGEVREALHHSGHGFKVRPPGVPFAGFGVAQAGLAQFDVARAAGLSLGNQVAQVGIVKLVAPGVGYRAVDHGCPPVVAA